jgi:hypothetical protein
VQFGAAVSTVDEFSGILGIGFGYNITTNYKNFVDELQSQGATNTKAFSLALGSKDEKEGVVIFGGLDTGKFSGTLQSQPIVPAAQSPDGVPRYWIQMNNMSMTPPSGNTKTYSNTSMDVFLDSGSTLTLLPTEVATSIAADFGADGVDSNGFYSVDCSLNALPGTVNFAFAGVTIRVPYSEFIRELQTGFGTQCYLGISPSDEFALLGDTMLRSTYAVFDQTNDAVLLAEYVNCGTNEVEITASMDMSSIEGQCATPSFQSVTNAASSSAAVQTTAAATTSGAAAASSTTKSAAISLSGGSLGWMLFWAGAMAVAGVAGVI